MIKPLILAIIALCTAYEARVKWQREVELNTIEDEISRLEDEIDKLASVGDAFSKLRIERLAARKKRKLERLSTI
jgi:hypothetical protein